VKKIGLIVLILLAAGVVWLMVGQHRMARQLDALRTENARLAEALAQRPNFDSSELAAASRRLEDAATLLANVGSRLSNVSLRGPPGQLATPTPSFRHLPRSPLAISGGDYPEPTTAVPPAPSTPRVPGTPVSSHSAAGELLQRSWGPEQVVGPPDTFEAGDQPTAWAPLSSQGGKDEWLQLNYDRAVDLAEVRVLETYNPGAIARVMAVLPGGGEMMIWEGVTPPAQAPVDTAFPVPNGLRAQSVKIYFDRTRAPGWNEIDAVEVVARDGSRQWATSAKASSSFADR
jgi:hypothetical protein